MSKEWADQYLILESTPVITQAGQTYSHSLSLAGEFFIKHTFINWINQINNCFDDDVKFDSISIGIPTVNSQFMVLNIGVNNEIYILTAYYDVAGCRYKLESNYCKNRSLFKMKNMEYITFKASIDTNFLISNHFINRVIYTKSTEQIHRSIYFVKVIYEFNYLNLTKKTVMLELFDDQTGFFTLFNLGLEQDETMYSFEQFFNHILELVFFNQDLFFELYPEFNIRSLNSFDNFKSFHSELYRLYNENFFDDTIESSMDILRMYHV